MISVGSCVAAIGVVRFSVCVTSVVHTFFAKKQNETEGEKWRKLKHYCQKQNLC